MDIADFEDTFTKNVKESPVFMMRENVAVFFMSDSPCFPVPEAIVQPDSPMQHIECVLISRREISRRNRHGYRPDQV